MSLAIVPVVVATLFVLHFYFGTPPVVGDEDARWRAVARSKLLGAAIFGLGSLGTLLVMGLALPENGFALPTLQPLHALPFVALVPVALAARSPANLARSPQLWRAVMPPRMVLGSFGLWAVYLLGYELLFRGLLLFPLAAELGWWPALGLSTGMYVLAHLHKPAAETLGCIPMGFVFGWMALDSGSVLLPWLLHLGIVVVNESLAGGARDDTRWWA